MGSRVCPVPTFPDTEREAKVASKNEFRMLAAKTEEFRRRAVVLARSGDKPVVEIAKDLQIGESCLRRGWRSPMLTAVEYETIMKTSAELAA